MSWGGEGETLGRRHSAECVPRLSGEMGRTAAKEHEAWQRVLWRLVPSLPKNWYTSLRAQHHLAHLHISIQYVHIRILIVHVFICSLYINKLCFTQCVNPDMPKRCANTRASYV